MALLKRAPREGHLSPPEALEALARLRLRGVAARGAVWLAAAPAAAWLLHVAATGEGDADAARRARRLQRQRLAAHGASEPEAGAFAEAGADAEAAAPPLSAEQVAAAVGESTAPPELVAHCEEQRRRQRLRDRERRQQQGEGQEQGNGGGGGGGDGSDSDGGAGDGAARRPRLVRLALEEAFFLAHVLGSLTAWPEAATGCDSAAPLDEQALWRWCCAEADREPACSRGDDGDGVSDSSGGSTFPVLYAAYHHLRAKGWAARPGRAFGANFLAYPCHPEAAHAMFAVVVVPVAAPAAAVSGASALGAPVPAGEAGQHELKHRQPQQQEEEQQEDEREQPVPRALGGAPLDWPAVRGLQRLAGGARKRLLLLHVVHPPLPTPGSCGNSGGGGGESSGGGREVWEGRPEAWLARCAVEEVFVDRWDAAAARQRLLDGGGGGG